MAKEIEKKYLVDYIPEDLNVIKSQEIHQTYLANNKEESLRVRRINNDKFTMTFKLGKGLVREEVEFPISELTYNQVVGENLLPLMKTRLKISECGLYFDLDIYHNTKVYNLKTVEVEFSSEEEANNFIPPDWFGKEVTGQSEYLNQNLWANIQ